MAASILVGKFVRFDNPQQGVGREFGRRRVGEFNDGAKWFGKFGGFGADALRDYKSRDQKQNRRSASSKVYDVRERRWVQAGATHQRSVDLILRHQATDVVGLHAAAVQNAAGRRGLGAE